ncbi:hypothetical protein G0029_05395 [Acinetobacter sp. YH12138]|uniref:hypothetical protein n=1 Tax=Acinetobacter sp. YH12138 TaxID=2601122 RepID=UPI0015D41484|nr:hypothetical protein [Acinetobacter sp. YH12138]QOW49278.1 hypothetical protein G0029_05395 [Acinetobacter sp. YH12138]
MSLQLKSNIASNLTNLQNVYDFYSADQLKSEYISRVLADGGQIVNDTYLTNICNHLVANGLVGKAHTIASASLGVKKDSLDNIIKLYNLVGICDFTIESHGAVTTTPKFIQPGSGRPYIAMNNVNTVGGGDVASEYGHFLVQDAQTISKDLNLAIISIHDLINKTTSSATQIPILSFADGGITHNTVIDYSINATPSNLSASQTSRVQFRDIRNEGSDADSNFVSNESIGTNFIGPACVNIIFTSTTNRGQIFKATSAGAYTINQAAWSTSQITAQVKAKRKLTWGGSGYLKTSANTRYSNLKLYDIFVLRKISDTLALQNFANFISSQV